MLLPAEGGFPFGRRPKVLLAVGELFVRARSIVQPTDVQPTDVVIFSDSQSAILAMGFVRPKNKSRDAEPEVLADALLTSIQPILE